jgi:PIN domain nuclease of toxin-antitoxin system
MPCRPTRDHSCVAMRVGVRRIELAESLETWLDSGADPRTVTILPVTPAIAAEVARLPATFQRDPADRLIVATCRALGHSLVTRDRAITRTRLVRLWSPETPRRQGQRSGRLSDAP